MASSSACTDFWRPHVEMQPAFRERPPARAARAADIPLSGKISFVYFHCFFLLLDTKLSRRQAPSAPQYGLERSGDPFPAAACFWQTAAFAVRSFARGQRSAPAPGAAVTHRLIHERLDNRRVGGDPEHQSGQKLLHHRAQTARAGIALQRFAARRRAALPA